MCYIYTNFNSCPCIGDGKFIGISSPHYFYMHKSTELYYMSCSFINNQEEKPLSLFKF